MLAFEFPMYPIVWNLPWTMNCRGWRVFGEDSSWTIQTQSWLQNQEKPQWLMEPNRGDWSPGKMLNKTISASSNKITLFFKPGNMRISKSMCKGGSKPFPKRSRVGGHFELAERIWHIKRTKREQVDTEPFRKIQPYWVMLLLVLHLSHNNSHAVLDYGKGRGVLGTWNE